MCEIIGRLWLSPGPFQLSVAKYQFPRRVASRALCWWVQGLEKRYERRSLCGTQVVPIGRHVTAALNYLANELILRQTHGNAIQGWSPLSTRVAERVAVAALLDLKHERTLALKCSGAVNVAVGYWIAAPGVHVRTPWRELGHASKRAESDRDEQYGNYRNWTPLPAFFSFSRKKWQKNQAKNCQRRDDEKERRLQRWRKKREQCVEPQEKIIGLGRSLDDCRVGLPGGPKRTKIVGACADCKNDECRKEHVFPYRVRNEGLAIFLGQSVILGLVGGSPYDASRHRPFVDAELQHHQDVEAEEPYQQCGNHEYMQRKKPRESRARDDRATQHQLHNKGTEDGNAAGNRRSDSQTPVGVLIEAHDLTCKCHAESHQQKKYADYPGQFTRKFVSSKEKHLHHMNQDNGDHEVGAPSVHGADEPAKRDLMIQGLQAAPCFAGRGHINKRQQNSGDQLQNKDGERGAAKDVEPAGRAARHGMARGFANGRCQLQAMIEPFANFRNQAHGGLSEVRLATGSPGVGSCPALIVSTPFSIL